jgi:hypothetical protein
MEAGVVTCRTWLQATSLEGTVAAIANAVYHATGKRVRNDESGLMPLRVTSRSRT